MTQLMKYQHIIDLILVCLRPEPKHLDTLHLERWTQDDWEQLVAWSVRLQVETLVYQRIKHLDAMNYVPASISHSMHSTYLASAARGMQMQNQLRSIAHALDQAGVPLIALKGIYLASVVYQNLALRPMSDIDIMVPLEQLYVAGDALQAIGYTPFYEDTGVIDLTRRRHLSLLVHENGTPLEVHWTITHPNKPWNIDPQELWHDAIPMKHIDAHVNGLSPENMILHLCLHASYQHQFVFGLHSIYDIARTIMHFGDKLKWDTVVERATRWQWTKGVYVSLYLARDFVGADVPENVLARLRPTEHADEMVTAARQQLFVERHVVASVTTPVVEVWRSQSLKERIRLLAQHLYLSRAELAKHYKIPADSPRIYAYYVVRFWRLWVRYGKVLWDMLRGKGATSVIERRTLLQDWLLEP